MKCPGCGGDIEEGAWICPHCEFIVDTSFLGNDITNENPSGAGVAAEAPKTPGGPHEEALEPVVARKASKPRGKSKARGKSRSKSRAKSRSRSSARAKPVLPDPADAPTGGLDVDSSMIVSADLDRPPDPPTDDLVRPVEAAPLKAPEPDDDRNTNILPDEVLPTSGLKPLDASLLQEVPENGALVEPPALVIADGERPRKKAGGLPAVKKRKGGEEDAEAKKREVLARAMARGPVQERKRNGEEAEPKPRPRSVAKETPPPPAPAFEVRSPKAEKIYQQALEDMEAGNLVSARTNLKLALTFDPGNERYAAKLEEVLAEEPDMSQDLEDVPKGVQYANQFYEKANDAENAGNLEEAVKHLEKAIRADPQGVYYNKLGTILAFQLGKLKEGRRMVEKAIQMSPRNKKYQKTLSRIMEKMGIVDDKRNMAGMLGGLLSKRK